MAVAAPTGRPLYGLDIETDTTVDGLDPRVAAVVAVAVSGPSGDTVLCGPRVGGATDRAEIEAALLVALDRRLAALEPGVLVTWNGAAFDLPFLADRARHLGVELGLSLRPTGEWVRRPLAGHGGAYGGRWWGHRHLDAYRVYRADVGASLGLGCSLKAVARMAGLGVVEVDSSQIHSLSPTELARYVRSDARLARLLAERRWPGVAAATDPA